MKRISTIFAAGLALALALVNPVAAQQPDAKVAFSGFYAGGGGGASIAGTELDLNAPGPGSVLNLDKLGAQGWIGEAVAGYDFAVKDTPFRFGVFAHYAGLGEAKFDLSSPAIGMSIANAKFGKQAKVGARAMYVINDQIALFGGGFWTKADLDWELAGGALKGSEDLKGWGFVLGASTVVMPNVELSLQWSRSYFETVSFDLGGGAKLDLDSQVDAITAHAIARF